MQIPIPFMLKVTMAEENVYFGPLIRYMGALGALGQFSFHYHYQRATHDSCDVRGLDPSIVFHYQ